MLATTHTSLPPAAIGPVSHLQPPDSRAGPSQVWSHAVAVSTPSTSASVPSSWIPATASLPSQTFGWPAPPTASTSTHSSSSTHPLATPFGLGVPSGGSYRSSGTGSRSRGRGAMAPVGISRRVSASATITLKVDFLIFPHDYSNPENRRPDRLPLAQHFLNILSTCRSLGLAVMHTFTGTPDTNIMTDVVNLLIATLAEKRVQLPSWQPPAFPVHPNEPNYDLHSTFHAMPFHLLMVGNVNRERTSRRIQLNEDAGYGSFTLAALSKDYKKSVSPTDSEYLLIPLCIKGDNLTGPIVQNSPEVHHCLSLRISALFVSDSEPVDCYDDCPQPPAVLLHSSHMMSPPAPDEPPIHSHLTPSAPSVISAELSPTPRYELAPLAQAPSPPTQRSYRHLQDFQDNHVRRNPISHSDFSLFAPSVSLAARAVLFAISSKRTDPDSVFIPASHPELLGDTRVRFHPPEWNPDDLTLSHCGGMSSSDCTGDGVLRQVLHEALQLGIQRLVRANAAEVLNEEDQYIVSQPRAIHTSNDIQDTLYACGCLCAMLIVWASSSPHPISPFFLQALVDGASSLYNPTWVTSLSPHIGAVLSLLPATPGHDFPGPNSNERNHLARLLHLRTNQLLSTIETITDTETWTAVVRNVYVHVLLAVNTLQTQSSAEFTAFKNGFDRRIDVRSEDVRLCTALKGHSKAIFAELYPCHINDPEQLISRLRFEIGEDDSDDLTEEEQQFQSRAAALLPKLREAVLRYLRGAGHPDCPRVQELTTPEDRETLANDRGYRARRFVFLTSSLDVLPTSDQTFRVVIILQQNIPLAALPRGCSLPAEISELLIPPATHACLFQLDIFLTDALLKVIEDSYPLTDPTTVTTFDACLHEGLMDLGAETFS
ncbi:hypothetical protein EUX98_g5938 [Antrodiella citrinella]|uniref:Uncharacterized protein n=1 Tax=Antrodiella citrinella TaxID=2447956 RepID=A0A4S4MR83_9APHY|nr:hypothetical protein EUX98_g5938 [Antrodiella citrinella]